MNRSIAVLIILLLITIVSIPYAKMYKTHSYSGSKSVLMDYGDVTITDEALYYRTGHPMSVMSTKELSALKTLSKKYVIKIR